MRNNKKKVNLFINKQRKCFKNFFKKIIYMVE